MAGMGGETGGEPANTGAVGGNWVGRGHFVAEKAHKMHKKAHQQNKDQRQKLHSAGMKAKGPK
jgi:hypothetical protein